MEKKDLRIIFMGTPDFAVPSLSRLICEGYNIVGVITAPDRPSGRGKKIHTSAIKHYAEKKGLRLFQPVNLKEEQFITKLRALNANLQIVVAFRMLPKIIWDMPNLGTFNLHASLLPQYRGAAPINHAIINGEKSTGLTTFFLDAQIDTGGIILQQEIQINENDNVGSLHDRMMILGADLVKETVELIRKGQVKFVLQSELISSKIVLHPAPKIFKENCRIDWNDSITNIHNFVRGLSPYPGSHTHLISSGEEKTFLKIFKISLENSIHHLDIGQIVNVNNELLKVAVRDGYIVLLEIQLAGKRRMSIEKFLRGFSFIGDYRVE